MAATSPYDGSLQMFVEDPRAPDLGHLAFLRWLVERHLLEHPAYGPSSGEFVTPSAARAEKAAPDGRPPPRDETGAAPSVGCRPFSVHRAADAASPS